MRMLPSRPILPRGKAEDPEAILRTAADIVELPGAWRQGALAEDDLGVACSATEVRTARVCTHGALHRATREGYEEQTARARRRVERLLARRGADADGFKPDDITSWNDKPGRTAAEIAEGLRAAAQERD